MKEKKSGKKTLYKILTAILVVLIVYWGVYAGFYLYNKYAAEHEYNEMVVDIKAENPVDFASLQNENDEIYAWITIEDTTVNYPIVQSKTDDEFYLKHSAVDKSWIASGAIYTESCNSKSFSDPITLVYGHNGYGDTMFTTLHYFEDEEFFNSHEYFNIYLPGRKLTYQVISAFVYDDRHIMNTFDFTDKTQLAEFQKAVLNPDTSEKNVRTDLDVQIDENSKITVLSTCITNRKSERYLVCAVLVNDEQTK